MVLMGDHICDGRSNRPSHSFKINASLLRIDGSPEEPSQPWYFVSPTVICFKIKEVTSERWWWEWRYVTSTITCLLLTIKEITARKTTPHLSVGPPLPPSLIWNILGLVILHMIWCVNPVLTIHMSQEHMTSKLKSTFRGLMSWRFWTNFVLLVH